MIDQPKGVTLVSFCCNDERGNTERKVTAIHLPGGMLDLETIAMEGVGFREVRPNRIRVSRRLFNVHGYRPMYGNVFWNGYVLAARDVFKLVIWAKESKKWSVGGGWEDVFDWWDRSTGYEEWTWFAGKLKEATA